MSHVPAPSWASEQQRANATAARGGIPPNENALETHFQPSSQSFSPAPDSFVVGSMYGPQTLHVWGREPIGARADTSLSQSCQKVYTSTAGMAPNESWPQPERRRRVAAKGRSKAYNPNLPAFRFVSEVLPDPDPGLGPTVRAQRDEARHIRVKHPPCSRSFGWPKFADPNQTKSNMDPICWSTFDQKALL